MTDTPEERTFKHPVSNDFVLEAITTLEWSVEQTKKFNEKGIYRGTIKSLPLETSELENNIQSTNGNEKYTLLSSIRRNDVLKIENVKHYIPSIIFYKSYLKNVEIDNCLLEIENNRTLNTDLYFLNCKTRDISLKKSSLGSFYISDKSVVGNFRIRDNCFTKNFKVSNSTTGYFNVYDSCVGNFSIWRNSKTTDFGIDNSSSGFFWIKDSSTGYFDIYDSITDNFSFEKSLSGDFDITNSSIGSFTIKQSEIGSFEIKKSTCGDIVNINSSSPLYDIKNVQTKFHFSGTRVNQCRIKNCDISELTLKNDCEIDLYISGGTINLISFEQVILEKNTIISFSNLELYSCIMSEFSALGNLYFRGIKRTQQPYSFLNYTEHIGQAPHSQKSRKLYSHRTDLLKKQKEKYLLTTKEWKNKLSIEQPTFRIVQSSLGKTEFTECDLGAFSFEYSNSKVDEAFISGGTMPLKSVKIYNEKNKNSKNFCLQKVAIYTQFKKIFGRLGDVYYESKFHALASHYQLKLLKHLRNDEVRNETNNFKKVWKWLVGEETFEILTYRLNHISNKHRASWGRSLGFILVSSSLLFTFYLFAGGALSLNPYTTDWDWGLVGQLFTFLNPTHRFIFMRNAGFTEFNYGFWSSLWDFVGRIVIGYGIYQFISAFRKHGKRA